MDQRIGIYKVDKKSSKHEVADDRYWLPELSYTRILPGDYGWSDCTLTNITITNNIAELTDNQTYGVIITPELVNSVKGTNTDYYRDITKIQIIQDHDAGNGSIRYFATNDGTNYTPIQKLGTKATTYDALYNLPYKNIEQANYYTLRIRVELRRDSAAMSSPTINRIYVIHNQI